MKFIPGIKRRWLRRIVMVTLGPVITFQYIYLGLRSMYYEFGQCWNFEHPTEAIFWEGTAGEPVHEGYASIDTHDQA